MAVTKKKTLKRKPKAKLTKPEPVVEVEEVEPKEGMNIKSERENLYKSWKRLVKIAEALLTQAEIDPLSIKASMMSTIVRVLSQSGKVISDYEAHLKRTEAEPVIDEETGEEQMSAEDEAMLAEFNRREALTEEERIAEHLAEHAKLMANPPKKADSEFTDSELSDGLNFRRD
jgi:hypothetical protein